MSFDPAGLSVYIDGEFVDGAEARIIELARERGIAVEERDIWPTELYTADAVFLTGSGAGVVQVSAVDGHAIATVDNEIATALSAGYRQRTQDARYLVPVAQAVS
jgi:branched-subunit amino acid aminotransferase/4-amino-4-deoxychorismate lyase